MTKHLVYPTSKWSSYKFDQTTEGNPLVASAVEAGQEKNPHFGQFSKEIFGSLFEGVTDRVENPLPESEWAHKYAGELETTSDYTGLQAKCRGNAFRAGIASEHFLKRVSDRLPPLPEGTRNPEEVRDELRGLLDFAKTLQAEGREIPDKLKDKVKALKAEGKSSVETFKGYSDSLDTGDLRSAIRAASMEASQEITDVEETLDGLGWGDGQGSPTKGNTDLKVKLAQRVRDNPKLAEIAKLAGRFTRIASRKRSKSSDGRDYLHGVTMGNSLSRLLPSEMASIGDPTRFLDFARRFQEKTLIEYKLKGKTPENQGPIVVCLDESSSMAGNPEVWSKALTLAIIGHAKAKKRPVRVIHYNRDVDRVFDWNPKLGINPDELFDSLSGFSGGGTNFEKPLGEALKAIEGSDYPKADVIFITDGEARVSPEFQASWNEAKTRKGFSTYSVNLGGLSANSILEGFSDEVIPLSDLSSDSAVTDTVFSI